jgi:hypothetical protein
MPRSDAHNKCTLGPWNDGSSDRLMTANGIVSRVTPVHTAVRNCTRDEGRSFEVGNQVLISSHRKLLLSKAMVVNLAETSGLDSDVQLRQPCKRTSPRVCRPKWAEC